MEEGSDKGLMDIVHATGKRVDGVEGQVEGIRGECRDLVDKGKGLSEDIEEK
ncbi:hypothetical protein [Staphylococcus saprophyticus]|uniref:hypothetical protein n=1 Tax=Staphylococcus saprophyticus TaxID=29385 RepID=UPI0016429779|nr:hypothetical protein [Staphylococcus saprophyticus]